MVADQRREWVLEERGRVIGGEGVSYVMYSVCSIERIEKEAPIL